MKLTTKMLRRSCNHALKRLHLAHELSEAFIDRYGICYTDERVLFQDSLIDCLDEGSGRDITLADADRIMTDSGYPPLTEDQRAALAQGGGDGGLQIKEPEERDRHYDRDGYCDNPARGY